MSSDPIKINIAFVVNFTGAWLEFHPSFFSNCTKQTANLLVSTELDRDLYAAIDHLGGLLPCVCKMLGKMRAAELKISKNKTDKWIERKMLFIV